MSLGISLSVHAADIPKYVSYVSREQNLDFRVTVIESQDGKRQFDIRMHYKPDWADQKGLTSLSRRLGRDELILTTNDFHPISNVMRESLGEKFDGDFYNLRPIRSDLAFQQIWVCEKLNQVIFYESIPDFRYTNPEHFLKAMTFNRQMDGSTVRMDQTRAGMRLTLADNTVQTLIAKIGRKTVRVHMRIRTDGFTLESLSVTRPSLSLDFLAEKSKDVYRDADVTEAKVTPGGWQVTFKDGKVLKFEADGQNMRLSLNGNVAKAVEIKESVEALGPWFKKSPLLKAETAFMAASPRLGDIDKWALPPAIEGFSPRKECARLFALGS